MIYGVSESKGEGMGYNGDFSKVHLLKTPSNPFSLSTAQTELKTYFVSAFDSRKAMNKS